MAAFQETKSNKKVKLILCLVLVVAAFFRFYLIGKMPGGLFPDEAANGLDINNMLNGHIQPFYERGNGREALFFYMLAGSVSLFGRGHFQHHIVSAAIGVLSILALYLLIARLYDKRTALLAAFLMSVGTWHIVLSRTAFRAILMPLFICLALYFIVRAAQDENKKAQIISAVLAGVGFGLGLYTYIAFRFVFVILAVILFVLLIADRKQGFAWTKKYFKAFLAAGAAFIVTILPMLLYFFRHPQAIIGRSSQVSVFNSDLNQGDLIGTILAVFHKSIKAFFADGDLNWRHNISGEPFLSPLISPFFGIALVVLTILALNFILNSIKKGINPNLQHLKHLLIIAVFWGMLVPVITTAEGIPHGLRSIGMVPAAYALSAIGIMAFARFAMKVWHPLWMEKLYFIAASLFLFTLPFVSYQKYFVFAYNQPENFHAFRIDLNVASDYLNSNPEKNRNFLVLDLFSAQTVEYLTTKTHQPYHIVDPENAYKLRPKKGDRIIFTNSTMYDLKKFIQSHKNTSKIAYSINRFGEHDLVVVEAARNEKSASLSANSDNTFFVQNLGDRIYWSWLKPTIKESSIKIWLCADPACSTKKLIKQNRQNEYLQASDHDHINGAEKDLYFAAAYYSQSGDLIKNFGIIKSERYK